MTICLLPPSTRLRNYPQLSTLAVLEAALESAEAALAAAHPDLPLFEGRLGRTEPALARAHAILRHGRRLTRLLADYCDAVHRDFRRRSRGFDRPF